MKTLDIENNPGISDAKKRLDHDDLRKEMCFLFQRVKDFDLFVGDANIPKPKVDTLRNTYDSNHLERCFDANIFIKRLARSMQHRFPKHKEIKLALSRVPPTCHSEFHLGKALHNIVLNAMQASKPFQQVSIKSYTQNGFMYIDVSDVGCGISSKDIEKVFSPFYTTKNRKSATGLGLAISQQIILEYDGNILVSSKLNKGTHLQVKLPLSTWYLQ
ncbi:ATP-binding protein [Glaciecola petra]|uniref:histidine kinase n=1 Tax=Glaciecola petra TaxID=3075602 RepID=A0ABU2ZUL6_9ALTE|nr:ATP-binding protein [Aestuariibacter sp. P117]MDT0596326.1 ATP-binding protein [Aestuariibacter sp. P117]